MNPSNGSVFIGERTCLGLLLTIGKTLVIYLSMAETEFSYITSYIVG
jgi:hypothetical protein